MPCLPKTFSRNCAAFALLNAAVSSAAIVLIGGSDALGLALIVPAIILSSAAVWFRIVSPRIREAEETIGAQLGQIASLQKRIAMVEQHMQHQISAHMRTTETEKRRAIEASMTKSRFMVHVSHSLRTPLSGLISAAALMTRTALTEQQHRLLGTMDRSARTLLDIVNDMTDLALVEGGQMRLEREPFDLSECVDSATESFVPQARAKGLRLNVAVSSDIPRLLKGDCGRLRQVLMNLVSNAIKFTEHGSVEMSANLNARRDNGARVRFVVSDTGPGMDPELRRYVFVPAEQRDGLFPPVHGSAGLGLCIVNELVKLMGGVVRLDSAPGKGTVIEIEIPFEIADDSQLDVPSTIPSYASRRALIVGADEVERQVIAAQLAPTGVKADAAADAWEAMDLLSEAAEAGTPFDIVIGEAALLLDADEGLASAVRARHPANETALIVAVDGESDLDLLQAEAHGQWTCLAKPIRRQDLYSALESQIAHLERSAAPEKGPAARRSVARQAELGIRVLVAEDNLINQEVMREHLTDLACTFKIVSNGEEAVEAFEKVGYDIVLMDCQMPEMDGLSAASEIRALEQRQGRERTPIVAVTAHAFERERVRNLGKQMDGFLSKPYTQEQLLAVIEKTLAAQRHAAVA